MAEVKEFVFTWMIENFPYCSQKTKEQLNSPSFFLYDDSEWCLSLYPRGHIYTFENYIACFLQRKDKCSEATSLGFTVELVDDKGVVLNSGTVKRHEFSESIIFGFPVFELRKNIHDSKKKEFLPKDTLTLRCRIWKTDGSFPEERHCLAQTHIKTGILTFLWCVKDFSAFSSTSQKTVNVLTPSKLSLKISFNLSKDQSPCGGESIGILITVEENKTELFLVCEFDLLNCRQKKVITSRKEIWIDPAVEEKAWMVNFFVSKEMLTQKPALYLPNGPLNIQCRVILSYGVETRREEEYVPNFEGQSQQNAQYNIHGNFKQEVTSAPNELIKDLLHMYQIGILSDVTLQAETESFQAHKALLCARSPVFHTMFAVDMKKKMSNNVVIDDLDACTVHRFLIYIYSEFVENLDLESATKLYLAGDKYEVLNLRNKCSEFILTQLTKNNVCEILLLADRHQDVPFKESVIKFILDHFKETLELEEWKSFMENNYQLAAEIMYQKYSAG